MPTFTYTSETVTVNTNQIGKTESSRPAFQMSLTDGTIPTGDNWRVTRVRFRAEYQTYTDGETIRILKGSTRAGAQGGTAIATGIKVGTATRTLTLHSSDATNRSRWSDLNGKYIALQGEDSANNILKTQTELTVTVTWESTSTPATITSKSASSVALGQSITFTIDPGVGCDTFTMSAAVNGHSTQVYASGTNTYTFAVPDGSNPLAGNWANYIPGASATATATLSFKMGGSTYTASTTFTVTIPDSIKPTDVTITSATASSTPLGVPLQNTSTITCTGSATAPAGATITYQWTLGDGQTGTGTPYTSNPVTAAGDVTVTLRVTDSRGRYAEDSTTVHITAYSPPQITGQSSCVRATYNQTSQRWEEDPEEGVSVLVVPMYTWSNITGNSLTVAYSWKQHGTSSWSTPYVPQNPTPSGSPEAIDTTQQTFALDKAYDIRVTVSDTAGNSSSIELDLNKAKAFMIWDGTKKAIGFGTYPQGTDRVEISPEWDVVRNGRGAFDNLENIDATLNSIGTCYTNTNSSGTSCGNYANVTICSITDLPAGVYIAEGSVQWPANTTGYRAAALTTNSSLAPAGTYDGTIQTANPNNSVTTLHTSLIFQLNSTGGIYLRQYQNSGGSLTVKGTLHCVRIR